MWPMISRECFTPDIRKILLNSNSFIKCTGENVLLTVVQVRSAITGNICWRLLLPSRVSQLLNPRVHILFPPCTCCVFNKRHEKASLLLCYLFQQTVFVCYEFLDHIKFCRQFMKKYLLIIQIKTSYQSHSIISTIYILFWKQHVGGQNMMHTITLNFPSFIA